MTLIDALKLGGGGEAALARHAVAALLNAANDKVKYAFTEAEVIEMVQDAYLSRDFEGVKDVLAAENELGCPLSGKPAKDEPCDGKKTGGKRVWPLQFGRRGWRH